MVQEEMDTLVVILKTGSGKCYQVILLPPEVDAVKDVIQSLHKGTIKVLDNELDLDIKINGN